MSVLALLVTSRFAKLKITINTFTMISDFTLVGAESYRIVGKKPRTKIYRLPYIDKQGRQQQLKEIKQTNRGYWIIYDNGEKKFVSVARLSSDSANLLKRERMVITSKEKGMPF